MRNRSLNLVPRSRVTRFGSSTVANGLFGLLIAATVALATGASATAGLVFTNGVDVGAVGGSAYAALRDRNFSNSGLNGMVYIGTGASISGNTGRGNNQNVPWTQQVYDFTYTYDPVQKMAATTWKGRTSPGPNGNPNVSYQALGSIPTVAPNELTVLIKNSGAGSLILTLDKINSVGSGGVLSGTNGSTVVTGGSQLITGASWTAVAANTNAYLPSATLFKSGFQLFGTVTLGSPINSTNYGNNENSKFEINLVNSVNVPVPEPSTYAMALAGLACGGWQMVRRRRAK